MSQVDVRIGCWLTLHDLFLYFLFVEKKNIQINGIGEKLVFCVMK